MYPSMPDPEPTWLVCQNPSCPTGAATFDERRRPHLLQSTSCPTCGLRTVPAEPAGDPVASWLPPAWASVSYSDHDRVLHEHDLGQVAALDRHDRPAVVLSVVVGQEDVVRAVGALSLHRGVADVAFAEHRFRPAEARRAAVLLMAAADLLAPVAEGGMSR